MGDDGKQVLVFGTFRLDLENRLLVRSGAALQLAPRTFDLLVALFESRGTVLDKETLFHRVWPGVFVEESNLSKNISLLRKCLGNGPDGRPYIETLPKRGYRFRADLPAPALGASLSSAATVPAEKISQSAVLEIRGHRWLLWIPAILVLLDHKKRTRFAARSWAYPEEV